MYNNKKGISDVVSTVLIILLVVAAVAIIGAIIINVVGKSGEGVNSAVACQTLVLKPTGCVAGTGSYSGSAQLGSLPSGTEVTAVSLIFENADGSTQVKTGNPATLTTVGQSSSANSDSLTPVKLKVGATLKLSDGKTASCQPKPSEEVACA